MPPLSPITVRAERPEEARRIAGLVETTYAEVSYSDHREHLMVEKLRASAAFVPELSLVAETGEEIVGHVMLTRVDVVDGARRTEGLALAPLSVSPSFQKRGVGRRLVQEAHARAAEIGFPFIVLVGLAGYYPQFGYQPLDDYPVSLPFWVPPHARMILPLRPGALEGISGVVRYAPEWMDH